jgi:hypothetical protein
MTAGYSRGRIWRQSDIGKRRRLPLARPVKTGLDYFTVDVDIDDDDKIYMLEAELGEIAFGRYIKLLASIYKGKGYYRTWDDNAKLVFSGKKHIPAADLDDLIAACLRHKIFDGELFEKYKILTSAGIQKRYFEAVKKRGKVFVEETYLLVNTDVILSEKTAVVSEKTLVNSAAGTQSKVKESKVKERKQNDENAPQPEEDDIPFDTPPHRTLANDWYKAYHKKTGKLIQPSEKDIKAASELLKRTDLNTAQTLIPGYFDCDQWWMKSKGSDKIVYSFQGFCRNFTELLSLQPQPRGRPLVGTCPDCGTVHLGAKTCPKCGKELIYAS